ncbi:hypothetical protein [Hymenobacter cellulosivorans]|uniref:Zinc ribbon domain-containing protein n=1 Tax=Hymenobacter cellulosivorans TaxID=2932249 RepID=A0ABY4FB32_9BACT|nr:hypothetical protein [Hymenobacter cellulosivorans]UOQ53223.1 hypothetical protein MUN80_00330 [Hymenobacter cellulosivorans]
MDQETVSYILTYHWHLLSEQEKLILQHLLTTEKLMAVTAASVRQRMQILSARKGWLITDKQLLERLADGPDAFRYNTAVTVFNAHGREKLLNLCPRCGLLARTPQARQCRHCGNDWH